MTPAFFLLLLQLQGCLGRGPHHPRGEPVVKHVHYRPTKTSTEKLTQDDQLVHDREHMQEHLDEVDITKMTDEELEVYYFQVHDTDKNSKLDGLEILQAILHTTHQDREEGGKQEFDDDFAYFVELIDRVLLEDDIDNDGYLSYPEYASGRKKAIIAERKNDPVVKLVS